MSSPDVTAEGADGPTVDRPARLRDRLPSPTLLAPLGFVGLLSLVDPALAWTEDFFLFFLFGLWPVVSGFLPSGDDAHSTDWIHMGTRTPLSTLVSFLYVQGNPFVFVTSLGQMVGVVPILLRYRFRLPDVDADAQRADYRLPVEGEWTVVNGGPTREHSHSWGIPTQRYALDLVITDGEGYSHEGDGRDLENYHCYGEPVVAPADGEVVAVRDGHRDYHRPGGWLDPLQRDLRGNYVVIEHADDEYSTLAHLQEGSVAVSEGDRVERGERVGRCGNSGNSTEPHLHFHVADRPSFVLGMGLPVHFEHVRVREGPHDSEGITDGRDDTTDGSDGTVHERAYVRAGQRVAAVDPD